MPKAASVNKALAGELNELRSRKGTSEDEATVGNAKQSRRARKELFK